MQETNENGGKKIDAKHDEIIQMKIIKKRISVNLCQKKNQKKYIIIDRVSESTHLSSIFVNDDRRIDQQECRKTHRDYINKISILGKLL